MESAIATALLDVDRYVGIDTDSGRHISTERSHFLWLDQSDRAKRSIMINGAGGGANKVGGVGPMLVCSKNWQGEMRYIIAVDAVYLIAGKDQPRFSVLGQMRAKSTGLVLKQCYCSALDPTIDGDLDVLTCDRLGAKEVIPLAEVNGILVLETPKHAATVAEESGITEGMLGAAAAAVAAGKAPPVFTLEQLQSFGLKSNRTESEYAFMAIEAVLYATTICAMGVSSLLLNEAKLSDEEKAWLWHWRWGHGDWMAPIRASEGMDSADALASVKPNVDCAVCDKAHFKRGTFKRNDVHAHADEAPYWTCYVDGYGGQESMGGESYGGAIGGFVFYCRSTKTLTNKLYASTEQFPILLYQFLQDVERQHFRCREIIVDTHSVNISQEAEDVAALFRVKITPISAGTPQELAYAESGVRVIAELSRGFMLGAPHLPKELWGLADLWAAWVRDVKPQRALNWKSSFEARTGRKPPYHELFIKIFGAPCNFAPMEGAVHKRGALTEDGWFVGVQWPMALVLRKRDMKVVSVSRKKLHVYEASYIQGTVDEILHNDMQEIEKVPNKLQAVNSVKTLRTNLNANLMEPGEKATSRIQQSALDANGEINQGESVHIPEHVNLDRDKFLKDLERLQEEALAKAASGSLRERIVKSLKEVRTAVTDGEIVPKSLKRGKKPKSSGMDRSNIVEGNRARKKTRYDAAVDAAVDMEIDDDEGDVNPDVGLSADYDELPDRGLKVGSAVKKLIKGDVVSIETTRFDGEEPGSYSNGKPDRLCGVVQSNGRKNGTYIVRWDIDSGDADSHWTHLRLEIPKVSVETILALLGDASELKSKPEDMNGDWPKNFFEALVRSDWREWVLAVKKENAGWIINQATRVVKYTDMKPGTRCIPLGELFSVKRDGRHKFRQIAFGNMLRPGKDYGETFASTVSADGMRWFFALACSTNLQIFGWDATVGYLQADLEVPVYAYLPSHHAYSELPMEELAQFRTQLLSVVETEGPEGLKRFITAQRKEARDKPDEVLELLKSVYGIPSSGHSFSMLMRGTHTDKCGLHQTETDPSIYIKMVCIDGEQSSNDNGRPADAREVECISGDGSTKIHCADGTVIEFLVVIVWTDDVRYFGTEALRLQYEADIKKNLRVDFEGPSETFVSCDFKQDFVNKTLEVTQAPYWEKCVEKNKDQWPDGIPVHRAIPLSPTDAAFLLLPVSDEDFQEAQHLEFAQILGQIQFPSVYTKLEMRFAISMISRQRSKWSKKSFKILIKMLEYGFATRDIGLMYSCGLDPHGVNKLYAYADSNFAAPRSQGCRLTIMNGCWISCTSKRHTTTDTSTCEAEATEFFLCTRDVERLRNLMAEVGLFQQEPTVIYQDNQPAIQIMTNRGSLPNKSKAMDIRVMSARNKVEDRKVLPVYVNTLKMWADIGTKALDEKQFVFLRDLANGYALVRARGGVVDLPSLVISAMELGL